MASKNLFLYLHINFPMVKACGYMASIFYNVHDTTLITIVRIYNRRNSPAVISAKNLLTKLSREVSLYNQILH